MTAVWIVGGTLAALAGIYLFMLFPRPGAKKKYGAFLGQIYAHRGVFDNESIPENSLAAFQEAIRLGVGIEFDIHRTADGEVVVFHDATLTRMCGDPRKITDLTLKELQTMSLLNTAEKIPTLNEVLDLVRDQVPLLACGNHILWVVGKRISEYYKVTKETKTVLKVQVCGGNIYE